MECKIWLHAECLVDDVLTKTYTRLVASAASGSESPAVTSLPAPGSTNGSTKGGKKGRKSIAKQSVSKPYDGLFTGEYLEEEGPARIKVTDLRPDAEPKSWIEEDVMCPKCKSKIT